MKLRSLFLTKFVIFLTVFSGISYSEPFVVLEYRGGVSNAESSDNPFTNDENFSAKHKVNKNETLTDIILKHYGFKNFNRDILSLSIVHFNKHAFVRKNPNYLFAGKTLHLPSLKQIKNLVLKSPKNDGENENFSDRASHIYFFGGY